MNNKLELLGLIFLGNEEFSQQIINLVRLKNIGRKIPMSSVINYLKQKTTYRAFIKDAEEIKE